MRGDAPSAGGDDEVGRRQRPGDIPVTITARPKRAPVDVKSSRRMFAGLLGTLKKAQDDSTKFAKSEVCYQGWWEVLLWCWFGLCQCRFRMAIKGLHRA